MWRLTCSRTGLKGKRKLQSHILHFSKSDMLIFIAYINPRKRHQNSLRRNVGIVCYYYELVTSYSLSSPVQSHPLSFCLHFILRDSMVLFQASSGKNCEYRAVSIGKRTTCCSFSKCYLHEKKIPRTATTVIGRVQIGCQRNYC